MRFLRNASFNDKDQTKKIKLKSNLRNIELSKAV